jgi:hypothetical protein
LESADFVHRTGQLRTTAGKLAPFRLLPYGSVYRHGAEADLRDVPLGTPCVMESLPGEPQSIVAIRDESPGDVADQQKRFDAFLQSRGLPARIDQTAGKTITLTFFSGDPALFAANYGKLIAKGQSARVCVANDELRTWNPPVDGEGGSIQEVVSLPAAEGIGCSGFQTRIGVPNMLEGFRRGRVVRVFLSGWKAVDAPYGESLMGYGYAALKNAELIENVAKEYPEQFPFRTEFGNVHLPWYQLKPGVEPPPFSEHVVYGSLLGPAQFLEEDSGIPVNFTLHEKAKIRYCGKDAKLEDIPAGTRCRFHLFGTVAALVSDDFSHDQSLSITWRIETLRLADGWLEVAAQLPAVKNYNGDMEAPPPFARRILRVTKETRVWQQDQPVDLGSLTVDQRLLANFTAELPGQAAHATDLWIQELTPAAAPAKNP